MSRPHGTALALLVATAIVAGPAALAEPGAPPALSISGRGNTYVDLTVPASSMRPWTSITVSGGKSYAGLCVRPLSAPGEIGCSIWLRGLPDPGTPVPIGNHGAALPAGRLRFYLVGDGPVRARLTVSGLRRPASVTTRSSFRADVQVLDLSALPGVPASPAGHARVPLARRTNTSVVVGARWRADAPAGATNGHACVTTPGAWCAAEPTAHSSQSAHWAAGWVGEFRKFYGPSALRSFPAAVESVVDVEHVDVVGSARAFVVSLDG